MSAGTERRPVVAIAIVALLGVGVLSLFIGVSRVTPSALWHGDDQAWRLLWVSRLPRLAAVVLAGSALAVAGLIMQGLTQNRFVSPTTAGTVEAASCGAMVAVLLFGGASVAGRMVFAVVFALAATAIFLFLVRRLRFADALVVPLVGILFGGVIEAITTYLAFRFNLLQALNTITSGNFAAVLRGRYELLYLVGALTVVAYLWADRFTLAGIGRDFAVSLGLKYERTMVAGLAIAATVTAVVVVVVGAIPFLGLVVPNIATALLGDNLRRVLPVTAIGGALFVLCCDIVSRTARAPYEIPVGTVAGVVGGACFIAIVLRGKLRAA